jgi:hypothetical protein
MQKTSIVAQLLHKPMDRKTFLKTVALGLAVVGGAAGLLRLFGQRKTTGNAQTYGSSAYGGSAKS